MLIVQTATDLLVRKVSVPALIDFLLEIGRQRLVQLSWVI